MNYSVYGAYRKIKNEVWQCLIDFGVDSLPVSSIDIAVKADIKVIKNSIAKRLNDVEFGLSAYQETKKA